MFRTGMSSSRPCSRSASHRSAWSETAPRVSSSGRTPPSRARIRLRISRARVWPPACGGSANAHEKYRPSGSVVGIMGTVMSGFPEAAREALADPQLRRNLGKATTTIRAKRAAVVAELDDWQALRDAGAAIKARALATLPEQLERLEASVTRAGGVVHWASDRGANEVIKVKSLASDEIGLNEALALRGISAIETDLAELIVQLGDDEQSHILVPAIHRNRAEIAALFERTIASGQRLGLEPGAIAEAARRHLREKFLSVPVAVSGANFGVAETGSIAVRSRAGSGSGWSRARSRRRRGGTCARSSSRFPWLSAGRTSASPRRARSRSDRERAAARAGAGRDRGGGAAAPAREVPLGSRGCQRGELRRRRDGLDRGRGVGGQRPHVHDAPAGADHADGDREGSARVARPRGDAPAAAALVDGRADEPVHVDLDRRAGR